MQAAVRRGRGRGVVMLRGRGTMVMGRVALFLRDGNYLRNICLEHLKVVLRGRDVVPCSRQFVEDVVQFINVY